MGAIILDGTLVEDNCVNAAGAIVLSGKTVKPGTLWVGSPAKYFRDLTEEDLKRAAANAHKYVALTMKAKNNRKDFI